MGKKQSSFLALFLMLLIVGLFGCSPKPKRHVSVDQRFSLEFPEKWIPAEKEMWSVHGELAMLKPEGFFNHDRIGCIASSKQIPRDLFWDLDRINEEIHKEGFKSYQDTQLEEEKNIDISELKAKTMIYSVSNRGIKLKFIDCAVLHNDRVYLTVCGCPDKKFPQYKNTFEKIIKSFKIEQRKLF